MRDSSRPRPADISTRRGVRYRRRAAILNRRETLHSAQRHLRSPSFVSGTSIGRWNDVLEETGSGSIARCERHGRRAGRGGGARSPSPSPLSTSPLLLLVQTPPLSAPPLPRQPPPLT